MTAASQSNPPPFAATLVPSGGAPPPAPESARPEVESPASTAADPTLPGAPVPLPLGPAQGPGSLKSRALRSSAWTLAAFGAGQLVRVVGSPLLALLLTPADVGTVGLVFVFVTGLALFTDVGIEQAVIRSPRGDDPTFVNTAFTVHAVRGALLWLATLALAFPVSWLFHDKANARDLLLMLPVAGLAQLIAGFNSARLLTERRHLRMGRVTLIGLAQQILAVLVQLACAMAWHSPWAIVAGNLAAQAFLLVASHLLLPGRRDRFCWDAGVRAELWTFGKWILVSTLFGFTAMQVDRPLMGKLLDERWLGLYLVALNLVRMPADVIAQLTAAAMFPALARAAEDDPAGLPRVFTLTRALILKVCVVLTVGVFLAGPLFVRLCYKAPWHPAGELVQWASLGGWFLLLQLSADRALLAAGRTRPLAVGNLVSLVVTVAGAFVGRHVDQLAFGHADGAVGFVIGSAVGRVAGHLVIQIAMARYGLPLWRQDAAYSALLVVTCAAGAVMPRLAPGYAAHALAFDVAAAGLVCVAVGAWAGASILKGVRA